MRVLQTWSERTIHWVGIAGALLISGGAFAAAIGYAEYSFLNQNISDLGNPNHSPWAAFFNGGMVFGSALMTVFIAGVAVQVHNRPLYAVAAIGMTATIGMIFVGLYPTGMGYAREHNIAAGVAFIGAIGLGASFTLGMFWFRQDVLPRWLVLPGLLTCGSSAAFLFSLFAKETGFVGEHWLAWGGGEGMRPTVWLPSLLEWSVLFSILLWSVATSVALMLRARRTLALTQ